MNHSQAQAARTRAQIYDILAQVLADAAALAGFPRRSVLAEVVIGGAATLGSGACRRALFALEELPPIAGADLRRRLELLVARPGHRPLALHESLAVTGRLIGPPGHEVARFYQEFGLEPDGELPDSASVELAFLAFLAEAEADALQVDRWGEARRRRRAQRKFLQEHAMRWLPQMGRALAASGDAYFAPVGQLIEEFLKEEQLRLLMPANGAGQADIPYVYTADRCNLCGFCVQTCPTGALWMAETDAETDLLLNSARCIGCARCLPICPNDALRMMARQGGAGASISLRQSPRARCPRCGQPTVSQAELDAVFARLDADPDLRHRLSLCNRCKGF